MKNSKIVALVATAALLVIAAAFTSMAATYTWYQQDDLWRCKDAHGDDYYDAWAKSGSDYYWLDGDGFMATETLVDEDSKYVDETGKMVKNQWVKVSDEEGNENWYYFQASGKKQVGKEKVKPVTVNGKKYIFNDEGVMLSGWVGDGYDTPADDDDDFWRTAHWYCGDEDDGAVSYGWRKIEVVDTTADYLDNEYWFWFGSDGKKIQAADEAAHGKSKTINGKEYIFDENGVMQSSWVMNATYNDTERELATASISAYGWYQDAEIGAKFAKGWFRVVPTDAVDYDNNYDETSKWFYAKSGKLAKNEIKSINGKKYGFNALGEMVSGLCAWDDGSDDHFVAAGIDDADDLATYTAFGAGTVLYYFSGDEDNDGSMKTGAQTVNVDGDDVNFYFSTKNGSKGQGWTGKQGNKYYIEGKKVAADDAKAEYQFFKKNGNAVTWETKTVNGVGTALGTEWVLISKTGSIVSSGKKKDGNGYVYTYTKANDTWTITLE